MSTTTTNSSALSGNYKLRAPVLGGFRGKLAPIRNHNVASQQPTFSKAATADTSANTLAMAIMPFLDTDVSHPAAVAPMKHIMLLAQSPESTEIGKLAEQKVGHKATDGTTLKTPVAASVGDYLKVLSDPTVNANHKGHTNIVYTNTTSDPANTTVNQLNTGPSSKTTVIAKTQHISPENTDRTQQSNPATTPSSEVKHNNGKGPSNTTNTTWSSLRNFGTETSTFINQWWVWLLFLIFILALAYGVTGRGNSKKKYPYSNMTSTRSSQQAAVEDAQVSLAKAQRTLSSTSF